RQVVKAFEKREWNVKGTGFFRADNVSVFKVDLGDAAEVQKRDVQHSLLIIPGGAAEISSDLSIESVPRSHDAPPGFINFPMNLSHRPGRWNKRLITLLETGQVYSHKKPDAKLSDKDSTALCNLSDFDVYQVTDQDMLKRLKVPKKHVLAIKSQQKN
ncbi:hypothetical protein BN1708_018051, partial [Verticillium longisporum]